MVIKTTRPVSWIKAARKDFEAFPSAVQLEGLRALTVATEGGKSDNVKLLRGFGGGVLEIVLRHRGDTFRVVYSRADWRGYLGAPRLSEKIDPRD